MPAPRDLSCYVLELSVSPGGSRWAELHVYPDPAHIRTCLQSFCANGAGLSAYHAIWYGATLGVWVIQRGEVVDLINVYPHITVRLGDRGPVPLHDDAATRELVTEERVKRVRAERAGEEPDEDQDTDEDIANEDYHDVDMDIYAAMTLALDWEAIAARLPALDPPLLGPGERTHVRFAGGHPFTGYLVRRDMIKFGSRDVEAGEPLEPPPGIVMPDDDDEDEDETDDE